MKFLPFGQGPRQTFINKETICVKQTKGKRRHYLYPNFFHIIFC